MSPTKAQSISASPTGLLLLTDRDVAEKLRCSLATVWRRVADGSLPKHLKIAGLTRFVESDVDAVLMRALSRDGDEA